MKRSTAQKHLRAGSDIAVVAAVEVGSHIRLLALSTRQYDADDLDATRRQAVQNGNVETPPAKLAGVMFGGVTPGLEYEFAALPPHEADLMFAFRVAIDQPNRAG